MDCKELQDRNMGVSLLKCWMCFEVILIHFWQLDGWHPIYLKPFAC